MEIVAGIAELGVPLVRPVLTIGNFDGLHRGHRTIMETVIARARVREGQAVVYTFDPHPRKVLHAETAPKMLTTLEQKLELLERLGIDLTIVEPFDRAFANIGAERFIREHVSERIRPLEVYVGYDFHFGKQREGSMRLLTEMGPHLGFAVTIIPEVTVGDTDVNSTRIRALLAAGEVAESAILLGRDYSVRGRVVEGDRRGRSIGFPTANLDLENEILPAAGVYASRLALLDPGDPAPSTIFDAVTNVGVRPTFETSHRLVAETHVLDLDANLYGRRVELFFVERLRAERRFPNVDALREQIAADATEARRRLGKER